MLPCSKKCYLAVLHHNTQPSQQYEALHTFPKKFHSDALQLSQISSNCKKNFLNSSISQSPPPPPTPHLPSLCSTVFFNAMNMLSQQFHITSNLEYSNNVTPAVLLHNAPPSSSSLQYNEHNLSPEVQHQNFSLLSGVYHTCSYRMNALPPLKLLISI